MGWCMNGAWVGHGGVVMWVDVKNVFGLNNSLLRNKNIHGR